MGSKESTLGDLIDATGGSIQTGPFGTKLKASEYTESGVPVISVGEVGFGRIRLHEKTPKVDRTIWERMPEYLLKADDIVFGRKGAVERSAHIQPNEDGYFLGSDGIRVRLNPDESEPKFIAYQFQSELHKVWMIQHAAGTTMPSLNEGIIRRIPITLPPFSEQKAIAHILGSLDEKIELNRKMNETLEGMAQALFKSWFVDFDPVIDNILRKNLDRNQISPDLAKKEESTFEGIPEEFRDRAEVRLEVLTKQPPSASTSSPSQTETDPLGNLPNIGKLFPSAFRETEELGWIPKGWEVKPLSDAILINPSVKLSKGSVAKFADMKALPTTGYAIDGVIEKEYSGGAKFQNDDVLFARITPCLENGKTGIVDFLPTSKNVGFGSTEFIILRGKGDLTLPFVACLARNETFRVHCMQSMVGSSGRQRVQNACFDSFYLAIPTENSVLQYFDRFATPLFRKSSEHGKSSGTLTKLRDTLLPSLISGDLRIPEAEPATEEVLS